jgi:3-mercaptopyruvate sulfurtransferase SseA
MPAVFNLKFYLILEARVWWNLKLFGHQKVSILEGGLGAWEKAQGPLDTAHKEPVSKVILKNQEVIF